MGKLKDFIKSITANIFADMPENEAYKKRKENGEGLDAFVGPRSNFAGYSADDRKAYYEQQKLKKDMEIKEKVFMSLVSATVSDARSLMAKMGFANTWAGLTPLQQEFVLDQTVNVFAQKQGRPATQGDRDTLKYYFEERIK